MPTLVMPDVPPESYEQLQRRTDARKRSVQEEAIELIQQGLRQKSPGPRLPDLILGKKVRLQEICRDSRGPCRLRLILEGRACPTR